MSLDSGQTVSHYEVLGRVGAGAMGEVYRVRDTRLGREVALKVLPDAFLADAERRGRFEREARTLASLNHPNVGAIHGFEEVDGLRFLVLEFVPGEDLCDCLERGLAPHEALDLCRQIAEGLEAAHARGVVHRDLKPGNVRVTPEGVVKVLDFGLAKPTEESAPAGDLLSTEAGRILGTPVYMSPEQARGKPVDARSDVWALGCILFEALAGQRPFRGDSAADVLAAVTSREPDWAALPATTPPSVRRLLRRCLEKDVRQRLQHVGEARIVLEHPERIDAPVADRGRGRPLGRVLATVAALAIGYLAGRFGSDGDDDAPPTRRLTIQLPAGQRLDLPNPRSAGLAGIAAPLALSPRGDALVYLARTDDGISRLHLRALDSFDARLLEGTDEAKGPFFSPDGQWIGFFREGGLFKVSTTGGGDPILVCALPIIDRPSASWGHNGSIFFSRGINAEGRLEQVPATGGVPEQITVPDFAAGESWHGLPQLLPDGRRVLFTIASRVGTRPAIVDLETGEQRIIADTGEASGARFFRPAGGDSAFLLFAQSGRVMAAEFDLDAERVTGIPRPVVEQVSSSALGVGHWDCSQRGDLVYATGNVAETQLVMTDRAGEVVWRGPEVGVYQHPRLSADGERLMFDWMRSGGRDIWIMELERKTPTRLTSEYQNMDPLWAPDGVHVVFSRFVGFHRSLHLIDTSTLGAEPVRLLEAPAENQIAGSWSPSGELLFTAFGDEKEDLWLLPGLDQREARPVLRGPGRQGFGALSPDGRYLAYVSDELGRLEVSVCTFPGLGDRQQVSSGGGSEPLWSHDGTELFLRRETEFLVATATREGAALTLGEPTVLFSGAYDDSPSGHQHYDVSRDGQRFALVEKQHTDTPNELRVILGWRPQEEAETRRR